MLLNWFAAGLSTIGMLLALATHSPAGFAFQAACLGVNIWCIALHRLDAPHCRARARGPGRVGR